jgi:hypothetical protein
MANLRPESLDAVPPCFFGMPRVPRRAVAADRNRGEAPARRRARHERLVAARAIVGLEQVRMLEAIARSRLSRGSSERPG